MFVAFIEGIKYLFGLLVASIGQIVVIVTQVVVRQLQSQLSTLAMAA